MAIAKRAIKNPVKKTAKKKAKNPVKKTAKKKAKNPVKKTADSSSLSYPVALPMTKQDRIWQAESDARTLARAEDVKKDRSRLKNAQFQAKRMAKEQAVELRSIQKIAKK